MGYSDPNTDLHVEGVCVDFDRFLADLESVAGTTDDKCEEFPTEAYHAHMEDILTEAGLGRLKLPLLFSVVLDEWLSIHGFNYRFTFLVVDKDFFRQIYHEYEIDKEIVRKCLSVDTDIIVVYTTVEKLNDLYSIYENLPSDLKEDYAELMCYFTNLDELHRYRNDIIHYSWCKNMTDVARHILNNDPDFTSLSESVTRYFDFEAYGQYLDDNGRFVETDHGIYELP